MVQWTDSGILQTLTFLTHDHSWQQRSSRIVSTHHHHRLPVRHCSSQAQLSDLRRTLNTFCNYHCRNRKWEWEKRRERKRSSASAAAVAQWHCIIDSHSQCTSQWPNELVVSEVSEADQVIAKTMSCPPSLSMFNAITVQSHGLMGEN